VSNTEGGEALPETSDQMTTLSATDGSASPVADGASAAWYAIWTRSHCERLVAGQLAAKGIPPFLPEMHIRSSRRGSPAIVRAPMFPGYLFVRQVMDKERYVAVLSTRGVVRILEEGWTRLTPIPDADIQAIQRIVEANVPVFAHPHLSQGERVSIIDGPLAGVEGVFVRGTTNEGCLVVSIDLLGRSVAVAIDSSAVVPIASRKAA
jgi:transcription antitermination factor NusG